MGFKKVGKTLLIKIGDNVSVTIDRRSAQCCRKGLIIVMAERDDVFGAPHRGTAQKVRCVQRRAMNKTDLIRHRIVD